MVVSNIVNISVYNLSVQIASGWTSIGVYRCPTQSGTFAEVTSVSTRITLVSGTEYYEYSDVSSTDISTYWYKCKMYNVLNVADTSFQTVHAFKANTSDLTQDLRYIIGDNTEQPCAGRYTIKELRRFVKLACNRLQQTAYRRRFKTDIDGIISQAITNMDSGILLLQAQIEVANSQRLSAADTDMSFSDGRGRFNIRTSGALKDLIKDLKIERDDLIKTYNRVIGADTARMVMFSTSSGVSS